ncbi:RICIN domain-containing protein [Bifidobacterium tsurumiense]|nr:RICIN domain-containing protein [Bifidobacterium tsurumiense]
MPDNPTKELPDKVSDSISDDDTVVSESLAVTDSGEVKDIETGNAVTDPDLVGTQEKQADPLAKTDGESFVPVQASDVKDAVAAQQGDQRQSSSSNGAQKDSASTDTQSDESQQRGADTGTVKQSDFRSLQTSGSVQATALQNNQYGAYWGTYNGTQAFFESGGNLFAQQAKGVVDVSQWQGDIDWQAAKNAGVEGAIIRISFGWGNGFDTKALRNIQECKRLGIPFGVYSYSYAYDSNTAAAEGADIVSLLRQAGVSPQDMAYPVFYDLEKWTWTGHSTPTNPSVYEGIVNAWYAKLQAAGYNNLSVYSYTSYLNGPLNASSIRNRTRWVASYGSRTGFNISSNDRGWQYTSSGSVAGISGNVDLNAFGNLNFVASIDIKSYSAVNIPNGTYFISSAKRDSVGLDVPGASTSDGVRMQLYAANRSAAQQYNFVRQSDGSYVITNVVSGKALDVAGGAAGLGAVVQQYTPNGSTAQRWYLRDTGKGGLYIQSALGNWVLDIPSGNTSNGTKLQLWEPNLSNAQQFLLSSNVTISTGTSVRISSVVNGNQVLDIPGASSSNGVRLQMYTWNGSNAQLYTFKEVGNAVYEIINVNSGKAIESAGAATNNGAIVQQYAPNHSAAQRWTVRSRQSGTYEFYNEVTNKALDIPGGNASNGVGLQLYSGNGSKAQQWTLTAGKSSRDRLNDLASQQRGTISDGTYQIVSALKSSAVLDVAGGSKFDGGNVQLYSSNGSGAQSWKVTHDANGYITLTNVGSGKVLDIAGGSKSNGANVQQYSSNGSWAQKWIAVKDGSRVKLVSGLDGSIVLDVAGANSSNGANVQIYGSNNSAAQRWTFTKR